MCSPLFLYAEIAQALLTDAGAKVIVGKEAADRFASEEAGAFDAILMWM